MIVLYVKIDNSNGNNIDDDNCYGDFNDYDNDDNNNNGIKR